MNSLNLHPTMGEAVIEHLSKLCLIPDRGLIAGQAVASAVSELFYDGRAVKYNDVDLFVPASDNALGRQFFLRNMGAGIKAIDTCNFISSTDGYHYVDEEGQPIHHRHTVYSVAQVHREDMLNTIECAFSDWADAHSVLSSFDMNNVQVGVDLQQRKLYWTFHFEQFMRSHQLEIVRLHTPLHSLVRYFTKLEELDGVHGNDDRMTEMVAAAYEHVKETHGQLSQWQIGARYQEKLDAIVSKVAPNFEIISKMHNDYEVKGVSPRFNVEKDLLPACSEYYIDELPLLSKLLRERPRDEVAKLAEHLFSKPCIEHPVRRYFALNGFDFLDGTPSLSEVDRLNEDLAQRGIGPAVLTNSLKRTLGNAQSIWNEVAKRGDWAYGYFNNWHTPAQKDLYDNLSKDLDLHWEKLGAARQEPFAKQCSTKGYLITEMCDGQSLVIESARMHHTIGGRGERLRMEGPWRFFRAQPVDGNPSDGFTLACYFSAEGIHIEEAKGLRNRPLTPDENNVLEEFVRLLDVRRQFGKYAQLAYQVSPGPVKAWIHEKATQQRLEEYRRNHPEQFKTMYESDDIPF